MSIDFSMRVPPPYFQRRSATLNADTSPSRTISASSEARRSPSRLMKTDQAPRKRPVSPDILALGRAPSKHWRISSTPRSRSQADRRVREWELQQRNIRDCQFVPSPWTGNLS